LFPATARTSGASNHINRDPPFPSIREISSTSDRELLGAASPPGGGRWEDHIAACVHRRWHRSGRLQCTRWRRAVMTMAFAGAETTCESACSSSVRTGHLLLPSSTHHVARFGLKLEAGMSIWPFPTMAATAFAGAPRLCVGHGARASTPPLPPRWEKEDTR
jgi:hypothetical protein